MLLLLTFNMFGCELMEYDDISSNKLELPFINAKYVSQKELLIFGINTDGNYKNKVINHFSIIEPPGIGGRYVISKETLPIDTVIKIIKVERCNNCLPFTEEKRFIVELTNNKTYKNRIIELDKEKIIYFKKIQQTHNNAFNIGRAKAARPLT